MRYWALTDPGETRSQNQDAYLIESLDRHTLLCVVCDGMGGAKSGNVASTLAADVFTFSGQLLTPPVVKIYFIVYL